MNLSSNILRHMQEIRRATHRQVQKMATEPYATRKLSEAEQRNLYRSLTPEKMFDAVQNMKDAKEFRDFNEWLFKMEQKENQNG